MACVERSTGANHRQVFDLHQRVLRKAERQIVSEAPSLSSISTQAKSHSCHDLYVLAVRGDESGKSQLRGLARVPHEGFANRGRSDIGGRGFLFVGANSGIGSAMG